MIKAKVKVYGVQPEMIFAHIEIRAIFIKHGLACTQTSIVGKKHGTYSLHPPGYAIDYRTKDIASSVWGKTRGQKINALIKDLKSAVPQCDFVFEHEGGVEEHLHAEFDPKYDPAFQHAKALYKVSKPPTWPRV